MQAMDHVCGAEAEPLHRYRPGGHHPTHLGHTLHDGRYKILHKLGFGGFSTTWIARDQLMYRNVALKIITSEASKSSGSRERRILRSLSGASLSSRSDQANVIRLLDDFELVGPNGLHTCLVFELLGPSVPTIIEERFVDGRLPALTAKKVCKQLTLALEFVHGQGITHGDVHIGNLVFAIPSLTSLSEEALVTTLGTPHMTPISRFDGKKLGSEMPNYLVQSARFPTTALDFENPCVKLIDFGESFTPTDKPETLHTPIAVRAPELLFGDSFDSRVDCWTLGCTMFELIVGQPPCSGLMAKNQDIIQQIADLIGDPPERWQHKWRNMPKWDQNVDEEPAYPLRQWLELLYFDTHNTTTSSSDKSSEFTRGDIETFGNLIERLLQYDPCARPAMKKVLSDQWFVE